MQKIKQYVLKHKWKTLSLLLVLLVFFSIPLPEFDAPTSTVVKSDDGRLLGAKISTDEQWRFSLIDSVPPKFETCIINFEDTWFRYHLGVNPISIARALLLNIKAHRVVSGGSTITMQTIRLARQGKARSLKEKLIEVFFATRYELKYSKDDILRQYASHAPFGGNVVGLEAASWRYFKRAPEHLSWAETATLAVLPNAPSLIYPGKNQLKLEKKRNRLLHRLLVAEHIDSLTYKLSIKEKLPLKPNALPQIAPHLLDIVAKEQLGQRVNTTIHYDKQVEVRRLLNLHSQQLSTNEIHNAAAIVIDNATGNIIAYVGNADYTRHHANSVDVIRSARSTGSIIKPLLFASMLNDGELLPNTLIPDIPLFYDGFSPENYNLTFDGAVPASEALSRSLNIPFVHLLQKYGIDRFTDYLGHLGLSTITGNADYYGLSLILGGAEVTLWDLAKVYSGMARTLTHAVDNGYKYADNDFRNLNYQSDAPLAQAQYDDAPYSLNAASVYFTFEAMKNVNRPDNQSGWESFSSSNKIAWKTGTSFGFRDAWAIGVSPQYTVGIWVGNADGEGRPGLTGVTAAAPLLFNIFDLLKPEGWFASPYDEFVETGICRESGHLASRHCKVIDTVGIPQIGLRTSCCPYHKTIQLDHTKMYRVNTNCEEPEDIISTSWFVLPPTIAWYYKKRNPQYRDLPPYKKGCDREDANIMEFVYPKNISKIYIPIERDGKRGEVIFEIAHNSDDMKLFWHLDNQYVGMTEDYHQLSLSPEEGEHSITVVDELGNTITCKIRIVR